MRVIILGGDGYLGWPTAMRFSSRGDDVLIIDNYLRRKISRETNSEPLFEVPDLIERVKVFKEITGNDIEVVIGDCQDYSFLLDIIINFKPEVIIHYAEQPSAPYSMIDYATASLTMENNLGSTLSLLWAVINGAPNCHIIKLGTMGEYGTPNIDIEEGWLEINHNNRADKFLYPRQACSLYHTTKIMDTDLIWFYVRAKKLKVTDLMQGPVYGFETTETGLDSRLDTFINYDDIFGTVLNRFITQAIAGIPLTVYGKGGQTRGFINIVDTIKCIELSADSPPDLGELRIFNQFTELFSVYELAEKVKKVAEDLNLTVDIATVKNPRMEAEKHYYNAANSRLNNLGLKPTLLTDDVLLSMIKKFLVYKDKVDKNKILPRIQW